MKSEKNTIKITPKGTKEESPKVDIIKQYGSGIVIAEIILIIAIGLFVFIIPKWQDVTSDTSGGMSFYQEERQKLEGALVDAQKLVKIYNNLNKDEREKLMKILPKGDNIPQLMSQLEALFATEEMFIIGMNMVPVKEVIPTSNISTMDLEIDVSAPKDYYQFKDALEKVESNIRLLNIKATQYSLDRETFNFSAETYFIEE